VKCERFTKGFVTNVRFNVVDELPPLEKQTMPRVQSETVSHRRHRCPPVYGMRLDRTRSSADQATTKKGSHQLNGQFDDSEIKDWLREIRIERIERILKPVKTKDENESY
jgi:hypothetical protein